MIYFVLLHYQILEETIECVDSILKCYASQLDGLKILVVDNASPNGSGLQLQQHYAQNDHVVVLLNGENLGFARGNNVGYRYAKQHGARFVIQVNNDTIFEDAEFLNTLQKIYDREKYAVLGPDILCTLDGDHQNPVQGFPITARNVRIKRWKNRVGLLLSWLNLISRFKKYVPNDVLWRTCAQITEENQLTLHGCCFIFSPLYIEAFDGMFDKTFMYYEEDILKYLCFRRKLKMYYSNELQVLHKRGMTCKKQAKNERNRQVNFYKQQLCSLKCFYDLLRADN